MMLYRYPTMPLSDLVSWTLEDDFLTAGANARIALALLRCARRWPHFWHAGAADELVWHLRPALKHGEAGLQRVLSDPCVRASLEAIRLDASGSALLDTRRGRTFLGNALLKEDPAFAAVFDEAERCFVAFINREAHPLDHNVSLLADVFELADVEARYLALAGSFCFGTIAQSVFVPIGVRSHRGRVLSALLGCSEREALDLMDMSRAVWRSGLLTCSDPGDFPEGLEELFQLSVSGTRLLSLPDADEAVLAAEVLEPLGPRATLTWPHLEDTLQLLRTVLSRAASGADAGVHILIHGEPGSGHMAFVLALLDLAGLRGYRMSDRRRAACEPTRAELLADLTLSRRFVDRQRGAVLVVEDAESMLFTPGFGPPSRGAMKDVLRQSRQPVVWLAEDVRQIDSSYITRFTCSVALPDPPLAVRRMWCHTVLRESGCSAPQIDVFAGNPQTTIGIVDGARRFVSLGAGGDVTADTALQAFSQGQLGTPEGNKLPHDRLARVHRFDIEFAHVAGATHVTEVLRSIEADGEGTVLLSGASGVGKTSLAFELARQLGRDMVRAFAGDFLRPYRGESGRQLLRWLQRHGATHSVLLLDDLDAFMGDDDAVAGALRHGLDTFGGVLVATACASFDPPPALIRRFTYRLMLLPLTASQRCTLFARLVTHGVGEGVPPEVRQALLPLDRLTPGDFFNVQARLRHRQVDWRRWLSELTSEHQAKASTSLEALGIALPSSSQRC